MTFSLDDLLSGSGLNAEATMEKQASVTSKPVGTSSVAADLEAHLTKQAHEVNQAMTTPAQHGRNIALEVLQLIKQAQDDGLTPLGANNLVQETSNMVAASSAGQMQANDGNPNQVLQQAIATALASGATHPDQLDLNVLQQGMDEGNSPMPLVDTAGVYPLNAQNPEIEKMAALVSLVRDCGMGFDEATYRIKVAEQTLIEEQDHQIKVAAVNELMCYGYDVNTAVELVKQAAISDKVTAAVNAAKGYGKSAGAAISNAAGSAANFGKTGFNQVMHPSVAHQEGMAARQAVLDGFNPTFLQRLRGQEAVAPGSVFDANMAYLKSIAPGAAVGLGGAGAVGLGAYGLSQM